MKAIKPSNRITFGDRPGFKSAANQSVEEGYDTFLIFQPTGGIGVPLGVVIWGWTAQEVNWQLQSSNVTSPGYSDFSSATPIWPKWVNTFYNSSTNNP